MGRSSVRFIDRLKQACSIPSISAEGRGLEPMADWLETTLHALGAHVSRLTLADAPVALLGEIPGPGDRVLMIYDHYDVQPVDPLDLWESPPFEPAERDGRVFARGAADNKGDLVARLCALETYRELVGELPFTVKFLIEGEEEIGSPHFERICQAHGRALLADDCVWEGAWFDHRGHPTMHFGCKGLLYVELACRMLSGDQHSSIAVYAPSAAWELLAAVASIKGADGRIAIEGFYDDVVEPGEAERRLIDIMAFDEDAERARLGVASFLGSLEGSRLRRELLYSPTANIAGFTTGYGVPGGAKTVLPAMAKMDFRLVPDQDAADIAAKLRSHLVRNGFTNVEVRVISGENPSRSPIDSALGRAVQDATAAWFGDSFSVHPLMWATGPMHPIAEGVGVPICSPPGVTRPDSNIHAPNENVRVDDFLDIVGFTLSYLEAYGQT